MHPPNVIVILFCLSFSFWYLLIACINHACVNLHQFKPLILLTSRSAPMYLVLGLVFDVGHKKVASRTTMKQRMNCSSDSSSSLMILLPKYLIDGTSESPNNARKSAFPPSSVVLIFFSPAGIPRTWNTDSAFSVIPLWLMTICSSSTETLSAIHCTNGLGTTQSSNSSMKPKPMPLTNCTLLLLLHVDLTTSTKYGRLHLLYAFAAASPRGCLAGSSIVLGLCWIIITTT